MCVSVYVHKCTTCTQNTHCCFILFRITARKEAVKMRGSRVSLTVSILFIDVVVLFLIITIIIIIIYKCEIFSLALYMPSPVAVRHLSMSRRQSKRGGKGREDIDRGAKNSIKIIRVYVRVYVYVCVYVLVQVCACTHSRFKMKKYELATSK